MARPNYKIHEGSLQEQFDKLRSKVQFYGGGFANGKTAAACVLKALKLARDYPGCNGLIARSTYPKLNDTIRSEFIKWCPAHWIKSFPRSSNGSNTCTLTNGSTINFRYVAQQGTASGEQSTSNLLSATYDWAIIDQIEDPEIVEKDFDDILGRLRGMTPYAGDDPTMPRSGPRWFIITANPTRNWVYKRLIKPFHVWKETGVIGPQLLCERHVDTEQPTYNDDGSLRMLLDVVEGSTYENAQNLEPDFIKTLESTYRGAMKDRFLMGGWGSYEGLIYPQYDDVTHMLSYDKVMDYLGDLQEKFYDVNFIEGYDFGIAVPSCYIVGASDAWGNTFLFDGFYEKGENMPVEDQRDAIKTTRDQYGIRNNPAVMADPSIFRRTTASRRTIGQSTADVMYDGGRGIRMVRGNNDILNGIIKVSSYLALSRMHPHPFTGEYGAPHLYITDNLQWLADEFTGYMWMTNGKGDREDKPRDKNDHGMDTIKYMLSRRPEIATLPQHAIPTPPSYMKWQTRDIAQTPSRNHRHG
jgi:hypothetical protein